MFYHAMPPPLTPLFLLFAIRAMPLHYYAATYSFAIDAA